MSDIAVASSKILLVENFEKGLSPDWQKKVFEGETDYQVVGDEQGNILKAESKGTASGLFYEIEYDPHDYPVLSWRWKIAHTVTKGDAKAKETDDYAARVYVVFPHWFFPKTRTLNYIWANLLPKGEMVPNAYTGNAMMFAVESGPEKVGAWVTVQRNIVEDYRRAFGEDPPEVGAIAIMTDTDNTGEQALAWYDEITVRRD